MSSVDMVEVVSEVNPFLTPIATLKPILSGKNKVAKLTFSSPKKPGQTKVDETTCLKVDNDGDLVVPRKTDNNELEELELFIEYENSTSLDKVGLQVWRGAFLLADFVIQNRTEYFQGKNILEVGSGTGLTSVVATMFAKSVTATDLNDPAILKLLEINTTVHNKHLINCPLQVMALDFLQLDWSKELTERVENAQVILAADVVYHVNITTGFVKTLKKLATTGSIKKDIFIAMEKRFVFTMDDMDTVAPMYSHFMDELENILGVYPGCLEKRIQNAETKSSYNLTMQFVPTEFHQYFSYERNRHLILLHLKSIPEIN